VVTRSLGHASAAAPAKPRAAILVQVKGGTGGTIVTGSYPPVIAVTPNGKTVYVASDARGDDTVTRSQPPPAPIKGDTY
jgi:hypothetical protein